MFARAAGISRRDASISASLRLMPRSRAADDYLFAADGLAFGQRYPHVAGGHVAFEPLFNQPR